jgi:hypothetical protein
MKYRSVPPLGDHVSALGFGAMRFPPLPGNPETVDEGTSVSMLREAIDSGINYIDTAYPYHGGKSEQIVGKALRGSYRDRVYLADKLPVWKLTKGGEVRSYLETQLRRLDTDSIDLYLIHALNAERWEKTRSLRILPELERARDEGLIRHLGFSFHDEYPVFKRILDEYGGWEFCQIQYNFMDVDYQAGRRGLRLAAERGLGTVIMEPLKGGQLAGTPPQTVRRAWSSGTSETEPVSAALRWLWDQSEVGTVLSGMSSLQQLRENLASAEWGYAGNLSDAEQETIKAVRAAYNELDLVGCTACGYCLPCPEGVNIPKILELYNDVSTYGDLDQARRVYSRVLDAEERADNCSDCGQCEEVCPQHLPIIASLREAHARLSTTAE